jgi:hypothetical protein
VASARAEREHACERARVRKRESAWEGVSIFFSYKKYYNSQTKTPN